MIISESGLELFNMIVYLWFAVGSVIIGAFSARELFLMLTGKEN